MPVAPHARTPSFVLLAAMNGTVQLVDSKSGTHLWAFSTGPAIYSSYQAPSDDSGSGYLSKYFVDLTDEWNLSGYYWSEKKLFQRKIFATTVDEMVRATPKAFDGVMIVGSRNNTFFELSITSGRLIHFDLVDQKNDTFYLKRTDYLLQGSNLVSKELLWNLSVAQIDALYPCNENKYHDWPRSCKAGVYYPPLVDNHQVFANGTEDTESIQKMLTRALLPVLPQGPINYGSLEYQAKVNDHTENELLHHKGIQIGDSMKKGVIYIMVIAIPVLVWLCSGHRFKEPASVKRKKVKKSRKNSSFTKLMDNDAYGRKVGKLNLSTKEIRKGSNGTIVFEGMYEGRPVAVKRLVQAHQDAAFKEIQNLIASDRHPNIVRWYGVEYDNDFVYLALERCTCDLDDLIHIFSDYTLSFLSAGEPSSKTFRECKTWLDSIKSEMHDVSLWKANGSPSPLLLQLMRDVAVGVAHLHDLGIVHRDLKPQNVLIVKDRTLHAKLSDMGISKQLVGDTSALDHPVTGLGSSGWQAPEQLLQERQTRAVDIFSLGCVLFYCTTGGRHAFGDPLERDINILKNRPDMFPVDHIPEAVHLFLQLLNPNPMLRPIAENVLYHPFFWSSEMRLSFLRDASDRVDLEGREMNSDLLAALESTENVALAGKWNEKMEPEFLGNLGQYRRYKFDSVRDLLRVIRNKLSHYRELPQEIQELFGPVPEGFYEYFNSRFPKLFIEVYKVFYEHCSEEEC